MAWKVKVIGEIRKGNYLHHYKLKWVTSNITDRQKKSLTTKNPNLNYIPFNKAQNLKKLI